MHALHYANELLVRVRLSFQKLSQTRRTACRNNVKNAWEKSCEAYSLTISRTNPDKPHFDLFSATISTSKKMFFYSGAFRAQEERELKKALRDHCATH